jgi:L-iditol 2-dehydrogenase
MYYNNHDIRIEHLPRPVIGRGELLLRIEACGICGSDVMEWYRVPKAPLVLGHEIAGVIEEVGQNITNYRIGDRVSASHHVPCSTCYYCQNGNHTVCDTLRSTNFYPGGFAEYVRLPAINVDRGGVYRLPENITFEEGTFIEPVACVVRGQRRAGLRPGQSVLIIGSGIAGLLHLQLAQVSGATKIVAIDIVDLRLRIAEKLGADAIFHAKAYSQEQLRAVNRGRLADIVIVCVGVPDAIKTAFRSVERGGTILFFAPTDPRVTIPFPFWNWWRDGITLTSSYAGSPADHMIALRLIESGKLSVRELITHRLGLAETQRGFELVAEARDSMKVIIEPQR